MEFATTIPTLKRIQIVPRKKFELLSGTVYILGQYTVAINELLCMKNAGAQIAMNFS